MACDDISSAHFVSLLSFIGTDIWSKYTKLTDLVKIIIKKIYPYTTWIVSLFYNFSTGIQWWNIALPTLAFFQNFELFWQGKDSSSVSHIEAQLRYVVFFMKTRWEFPCYILKSEMLLGVLNCVSSMYKAEWLNLFAESTIKQKLRAYLMIKNKLHWHLKKKMFPKKKAWKV